MFKYLFKKKYLFKSMKLNNRKNKKAKEIAKFKLYRKIFSIFASFLNFLKISECLENYKIIPAKIIRMKKQPS